MRCPEKVSTCQQASGPVLRQSPIIYNHLATTHCLIMCCRQFAACGLSVGFGPIEREKGCRKPGGMAHPKRHNPSFAAYDTFAHSGPYWRPISQCRDHEATRYGATMLARVHPRAQGSVDASPSIGQDSKNLWRPSAETTSRGGKPMGGPACMFRRRGDLQRHRPRGQCGPCGRVSSVPLDCWTRPDGTPQHAPQLPLLLSQGMRTAGRWTLASVRL